jgi:hypothetical protein
MRILILEDNLLWSIKLAKALSVLGHVAKVDTNPSNAEGSFDLAIVSLADPRLCNALVVGILQGRGTRVMGHAGHKEKNLFRLGREIGIDHLVTNGMLSKRLAKVVGPANSPDS